MCLSINIYEKSSIDMSEIETASIDLILTSPPYWDIKDYHHPEQLGKGLTYKHYLKSLNMFLLECMRVVKEDGFIAIIVADVRKNRKITGDSRSKMYPIHSDIIQQFIEMDFIFSQHFIWRKMGINKPKGKIIYGSVGRGVNKKWAAPPNLYNDLMIEHILIFRKPGTSLATINLNEKCKDEFTRISKSEVEQWMDPVWIIDSPESQLHPATFPKEIARRLIRLYSLRNDKVLDPFMGTGTTLQVAIENQRNAIGYEINRGSFEPLIEKYSLQKTDHCYNSIINPNELSVD